jgi:hypothetical protein
VVLSQVASAPLGARAIPLRPPRRPPQSSTPDKRLATPRFALIDVHLRFDSPGLENSACLFVHGCDVDFLYIITRASAS